MEDESCRDVHPAKTEKRMPVISRATPLQLSLSFKFRVQYSTGIG